jgi:hypothetical protein
MKYDQKVFVKNFQNIENYTKGMLKAQSQYIVIV